MMDPIGKARSSPAHSQGPPQEEARTRAVREECVENLAAAVAAATPELGELDAQCKLQSKALLASMEEGRLEIIPTELGARLQAAFPFTEAAWQAIERFAATTGDGAGLREVNLLMVGVALGPAMMQPFVESLRHRLALQSVELFFGYGSQGSVDLSRLPLSIGKLRVNSVDGLLLKVPKGLKVVPSDGPSSATMLQYMDGPVAVGGPVAVNAPPSELQPRVPRVAEAVPQPLLEEILHHRLDAFLALTGASRAPMPAMQARELGDILCRRAIHLAPLARSEGKHEVISVAGRKVAAHPAEGRPTHHGVSLGVFGHLLRTGDRVRLTRLVELFNRLDAHSAKQLKERLCRECTQDVVSVLREAPGIRPDEGDRQLAVFLECGTLLDSDEIVQAALGLDPRFAAAIYAGKVAGAGEGMVQPGAASKAQGAQARALVHDRAVTVRDIRKALKASVADGARRWRLKMALIERRARVDDRLLLESVAPHLQTPELCMKAVRERWENLAYARRDLRSADLCLAAVKCDAAALAFVPRILRTKQVCLAAFHAPKRSPTPRPLADYVPRHLRHDADVRAAFRGFPARIPAP